jgi:hypothetical protein
MRTLIAAAAALLLFGCSTQQLYNTTQAWQRQECMKMPDVQERQRCLDSNARSYEDYRRQAEAAKRP